MSEPKYRWECDCGTVLEAETAHEIGRKYHGHMRAQEHSREVDNGGE